MVPIPLGRWSKGFSLLAYQAIVFEYIVLCFRGRDTRFDFTSSSASSQAFASRTGRRPAAATAAAAAAAAASHTEGGGAGGGAPRHAASSSSSSSSSSSRPAAAPASYTNSATIDEALLAFRDKVVVLKGFKGFNTTTLSLNAQESFESFQDHHFVSEHKQGLVDGCGVRR